MLVSRDWLNEYVELDMPVETLTGRLTMSGLNREGIAETRGETVIDLEVTSNRPDCLGHIGVAREIAVLFGKELKIPAAHPATTGGKAAAATSVEIECEDLCPRYTARLIRGVKIGPSPEWMQRRLEAVGLASINNVVDFTNYVLLECGQPLHAFDFDKLRGGRIVVRRPRSGEKITAIDQRIYTLDAETCVIADAERPVAIGGVMGGLDTEIGEATRNVLIEVADFDIVSIRNTARRLGLHSPSSYRFERGIDPENIDWASRRCCELILELAGGELLEGVLVAGPGRELNRSPIRLRFAQIPRILGIDVPRPEAVQILTALGLEKAAETDDCAEFIAPSWRWRDLTREADLIEEIARIHGYDEIPDDVTVPLTVSARTRRDRVTSLIREVLTGAGFFEAMTFSFVSDELSGLFTPRGDLPHLRVEHSSRRHESLLRQSLIPSLMKCRRDNERQGNIDAELFEIARVYLRAAPSEPEEQVEPTMIGLVTGRAFREAKGVIDAVVQRLNRRAVLAARPASVPQFAKGRGAELLLNGRPFGWLGEIDRSVADRLDLREAVTVSEIELAALEALADLQPACEELPQFPAVERDLNFVLDEPLAWQAVEETVRAAAGPLLESVRFGGQYRGRQIDPGRKSYVVALSFRAPDRTLTSEVVDSAVQSIVAACENKLQATLRS